MKISTTFQGNPLTIDAPAEDIRAALDTAIRGNVELYALAVEVVGGYLNERTLTMAGKAVTGAMKAQTEGLSRKGIKARKKS